MTVDGRSHVVQLTSADAWRVPSHVLQESGSSANLRPKPPTGMATAKAV